MQTHIKDAAILDQMAALRASIRQQRDNAMRLWDEAIEPENSGHIKRLAQGRFTEQLMKG